MGIHKVHNAMTGGRVHNLGTFGDEPKADPKGFLQEQDQAASGPVANLQAALNVRQNRMDADLHGQPTRSISGPLPDMAWDAFFGSMQKTGDNAQRHGLRFKPDLAGSGPGTGIGTLGMKTPSGIVEHPLEDAGVSSNPLAGPQISGLQQAAHRVSQISRQRGY
jgi:hypothetical protein